jgi:hypothetical protein
MLTRIWEILLTKTSDIAVDVISSQEPARKAPSTEEREEVSAAATVDKSGAHAIDTGRLNPTPP